MINNNICEGCLKKVVCSWYVTIYKKFHEDSKGAFDMTVTLNKCEQFQEGDE